MKTKQKSGEILAVFALVGMSLFTSQESFAGINDGLVAYYSFDDCTANDKSGYGNHGSKIGTTCTAGKIKNYLTFDGNSDYIEVANSPELSPARAVTVSAWVKPNGFFNGECKANYIVSKGQQILSPGFFSLFYYDPATVTGGCSANSGKHVFSFTTTFSDGTWGHGLLDGTQNIVLGRWYLVTATYDGATAKLYVNGKLDAQKYVGKNLGANSENLTIGALSLNFDRWPYWVNGGIDDVRIYNRALSATEANTLYLLSNPIQGTAPWNTGHTVTCQNVTQNTSIVIPQTSLATWDCEKAGLRVKSGDRVKVLIDGTKY